MNDQHIEPPAGRMPSEHELKLSALQAEVKRLRARRA